MRRYILLFAAMLFTLTCTVAFGHAGKTDSNGGHYDYSTGEYHYHHGYPAHKHTNGRCPYDFVDKTGEGSGSSSSISSYNWPYTSAPRPTSTPRRTTTPRPTKLTSNKSSGSSFSPFERLLMSPLTYIIGLPSVLFICLCISNSIESKNMKKKAEKKRIAFEIEKQAKEAYYGARDLRSICNIPRNIILIRENYYGKEAIVPYEADRPSGYKYGLSVDVYTTTNCYHRKTCYHAKHTSPLNAYLLYRPRYRACALCKPEPLPSKDWYSSLIQHLSICEEYGITPRLTYNPYRRS